MDIWNDKYRIGEEVHPHESMARVVKGVYKHDPSRVAAADALEAMQKCLWVPAGRTQLAAGSDKVITMVNCFVDREIEDSMVGISDALKDAMLSMQQGGGIGMDFSPLRPVGANLERTGTEASGPLPFMDMWDSMCSTIKSAGSRRGAMMATMNIEHPDIVEFIQAKREQGRLTNFNLSVLVTDAFMDAMKNDEEWHLGCNVPRHDGKHLFITVEDSGQKWYAYKRWNARKLWELIMENTYEYSEPGVIFIDKINEENNLKYCEEISCTNPCGEQPLPPNGSCVLGAVNLARMVIKPFTTEAHFDFKLLQQTAKVGVRFLDNVVDESIYPLEAQRDESQDKRRVGLGITGLANCLAQLGEEYGGPPSLITTANIMSCLKETAYDTSALLAKERGPFPLYDDENWGQTSIVESLPTRIRNKIKKHGIRNGTLLTVAPTGTTSLYVGNVSSGLEPVFLPKLLRKVLQRDDSMKEYTAYDYGHLLYAAVTGSNIDTVVTPDYMQDFTAVTPVRHLAIQEVCQMHIDASVSKTINCPEITDLETIGVLYEFAYEKGCKGCTTYRPSNVRGSILSAPDDTVAPVSLPLIDRPQVLAGHTYKLKWPNAEDSYYVHINDHNNKPFEIFISSTSSKYTDWTTALSLMISANMRRSGDISFIPEELSKVVSVNDAGWINGKFYGSLVALIGETIQAHLNKDKNSDSKDVAIGVPTDTQDIMDTQIKFGVVCPQCNNPTLFMQESCSKCTNCGYSTCG